MRLVSLHAPRSSPPFVRILCDCGARTQALATAETIICQSLSCQLLIQVKTLLDDFMLLCFLPPIPHLLTPRPFVPEKLSP